MVTMKLRTGIQVQTLDGAKRGYIVTTDGERAYVEIHAPHRPIRYEWIDGAKLKALKGPLHPKE